MDRSSSESFLSPNVKYATPSLSPSVAAMSWTRNLSLASPRKTPQPQLPVDIPTAGPCTDGSLTKPAKACVEDGFLSKDYRCHNRRFLVVRQRWSSLNPNVSEPRSRTENLDFWSSQTHQLLGRLKSTIPNLPIYLPKKANSEKLGLGIDNPCRIVFRVWK